MQLIQTTHLISEECGYVTTIKKSMRQRRTCFLTDTRIGLPIGVFAVLKIFAIVSCIEFVTSSSYVILNKRDDDDIILFAINDHYKDNSGCTLQPI